MLFVKLRVKRGADYQSYEVPYEEGMTVLSALQRVKEEIDPSLTFRHFCRAGICGTCTIMINGFPKLACKEQVLPYVLFGQELVLEPLANFKVIRDLAVDNDGVLKKVKDMHLWIKEKRGQIRIEPELSKRIESSADCILCFACQSYCPQVLEEGYAGPLFFAKLYRLYLDPREEEKEKRSRQTILEGRLYHCLSCNKCNNVCPKEVEPANLIRSLMKLMDVPV